MEHSKGSLPALGAKAGGASPFDRIMLLDHKGEECWSARDLQRHVGYDRWESFEDVLKKAMEAVEKVGLEPLDHFRGATKMIKGGRWGQQQVSDYRLTRYACYMTAMSADSRKPEVAAAKTYFAVKTREAELAQAAPAPDISSPEGVVQLAELYLKTAKAALIAQKELELAKPKASKWDAFCNADNLIDMGTAAKALTKVTGGLGRNKFMDLLRTPEIHFLQVQNPRLPYEHHVQAHRAEVKWVPAANGGMVEQTFFTPKGLDWLVDQLGGGQSPAA